MNNKFLNIGSAIIKVDSILSIERIYSNKRFENSAYYIEIICIEQGIKQTYNTNFTDKYSNDKRYEDYLSQLGVENEI